MAAGATFILESPAAQPYRRAARRMFNWSESRRAEVSDPMMMSTCFSEKQLHNASAFSSK
jgi:hypothetical protein